MNELKDEDDLLASPRVKRNIKKITKTIKAELEKNINN